MKAQPLTSLRRRPRPDQPWTEPTHPSQPRRDPQPWTHAQHIAFSGINYDPRKRK
jgi:hypothetical protein